MKNIIILFASVLGCVQGVDTQGAKTLLVGVRPHEFAKRDYYKKLAPNTGLWALTDNYNGLNTGEQSVDHSAGFVNFYGKKVGFNGAKDDELDYDFDNVYGESPNKAFIQQLLRDFQNNPNMHHKKEIFDNVTKNGVLDDEGVRYLSDKSCPPKITDPMIMYGMSFVNTGGLTEEGKKHTDKFDTVIVDQNVMKFLVTDIKPENVVRAIGALNALVKVGGDLIVLQPGCKMMRSEFLTGKKCYDALIEKGVSHDVAKKMQDKGLARLTDDLDSSVEETFSGLKDSVFDDVRINKDMMSDHGGIMIRFHNKKKDILGY